MKKVVRLTESKLKSLIAEAVQKTLNEYGETDKGKYTIGRAIARAQAKDGEEYARELANHFTKQHGIKYDARQLDDECWLHFDDEPMGAGYYDQNNFQRHVKSSSPSAKMAAQDIKNRTNYYDSQNPKNLEAQKRAQKQAIRQKFKLSNFL